MDTIPSKGFDGIIKCGVTHLAHNTKTNELLAMGQDHRITYWNLGTLKSVRQLQAGYEVNVNAFSISPDGKLIIVGDETGEIKVFTYSDCRLVHIETVHSAGISAISISPDNTTIVSADEMGQIIFWGL